ncbi:hypothetical protein CDD81_6642 [Ophiocordyceps australis]|uniref:Uncharacterized protein n=1 Tax=Ophiocordyceps australis TaxID=1399860 RepID=A0A2C5Y6I7_9HYPO|nr:hypothetical protein CDD81_6642 [Ophiocordyceps australis]
MAFLPPRSISRPDAKWAPSNRLPLLDTQVTLAILIVIIAIRLGIRLDQDGAGDKLVKSRLRSRLARHEDWSKVQCSNCQLITATSATLYTIPIWFKVKIGGGRWGKYRQLLRRFGQADRLLSIDRPGLYFFGLKLAIRVGENCRDF